MASGEMLIDITTFRGLDQSQGEVNDDIRTSPDMVNFIIENGAMMSAPGASPWAPELPVTGETTIMEAAYHREDGSTEFRLIAGAGGNLYKLEDGAWVQIGSGYKSDRWDSINYRKELEEWHIITNGVDAVQYGTREGGSYQAVEGVPANGRYIALSDERLWLGGVDADQEIVYWSWDNDPNNWTVDLENPEQGGGFIYIRTHDGTRIIAVKALLNDVVIFKDRSMHRITGSYPGEYELINVYGSEGPISENTIVSTGSYVYFLGTEGLCVYNGVSVQSLALSSGDNRLKRLAERINREAAQKAASVIYKGKMYVAMPIDGSEVNNAVLIWDMSEKIYTLMSGYRVDSWLVYHADNAERLLFARGNRVMVMEGDTNDTEAIDARWISPWMDAGGKNAKKSSGRVYMSIEARSLDGSPPKVRLVMQSEKKIRAKEIEIKKSGQTVIRPRVKVRGRMLRFGIETVDGSRLTIRQGVQIKIESDED